MSLLADIAYCGTIIPHYIYHRFVTGKYGAATSEKLGCLPESMRPQKRCLWVHAVSVGEVLAARTLISAFEKRYPDWDVRVSVTTATGREVALKNFGADRVFYYPLDCSWMVRRAFETINPALIILMELEVWPNFLETAGSRNIPVAVSNVRITERSAKRFKALGNIAKGMLDQVSLWLSQSEHYSNILREIGVDESSVHTVGSIKYDNIPEGIDLEARDRYRRIVGAREDTFVLIAGSTHEGEDQPSLEAFAALKGNVSKNARLVLVPRHPERLDTVEKLALSYGTVQRRTEIEESGSDAEIILVDTMGELGSLYSAADAVIMGGTFTKSVGGHNMMEPCAMGRPTIIGPYVHNFSEPAELLLNAGGLIGLKSASELPQALENIASDPEKAGELGRRATEALSRMRGATDKSLDLLSNLIET